MSPIGKYSEGSSKLPGGLKVPHGVAIKGDRVALDEEDDDGEQVCISEPLENLKNFQLIYVHPEALVENKAVMQLLKTTECVVLFLNNQSKPPLERIFRELLVSSSQHAQ